MGAVYVEVAAMTAFVSASCSTSAIAHLQARFLAIKPRIEQHARAYFCYVRCRDTREDRVAETVAIAWKWFVSLAKRGKDATQYPATLASYAARAVRNGRRLCGQLRARDAMSETAQQRHGFCVGKLPDFSTLSENPLIDALHDNTRTPPPDAAAFRIDWRAWRRRRSRRDRRIMDRMMLSERTQDLARQFRISPSRVSQLRREFQDDWMIFCSDD